MDDKQLRRRLFYLWFFRMMAAAGSTDDALLQTNRILADGGVITDTAFLSSLITDLKAGGCYSILDGLFIPIAIKKDVSDKVSKIYDLSPAKSGGVYYDCIQATGALQQTWQNNQMDGKPWIMFTSTAGGYFASGVSTVGQPITTFLIARKDAGGTVARMLVLLGTVGVPCSALYYEANTTQVSTFGGGNVLASTDQTTLAQFTSLLNSVSTNIRRKGVSLNTGNTGNNSSSAYCIGAQQDGSFTHNGPLVFAAVIRQAITTTQRDYIEGLLNTKYYPSSV